MNKTQLISDVASKTSLSKTDVERIINACFEVVSDALINGEKVQFIGFGSFEPTVRAARTCRNPKDGTLMTIPETKTVRFKVGKGLKESLAKTMSKTKSKK